MFYVLTDESEVIASTTFIGNEDKLANLKCMASSDGNYLWKAGSNYYIQLPKSRFYHHIMRQDLRKFNIF